MGTWKTGTKECQVRWCIEYHKKLLPRDEALKSIKVQALGDKPETFAQTVKKTCHVVLKRLYNRDYQGVNISRGIRKHV